VLEHIKNLFKKKTRKRVPEPPYAIIDFTEESSEIGGNKKEIILVDGRGVIYYPHMDCYINMLRDAGIPVIDLTKGRDIPLDRWERHLVVKYDMGVIYKG